MLSFIEKNTQQEKEKLNRWAREHNDANPVPGDVETELDIPYGSQSWARMDLYRPKGKAGPLPVIVNFHGGGLLMGSKELNRPLCAQMAQARYLVFCPEYPLVPEVTVYDQYAAAAAAMERVNGLLEEKGGCRNRVYLVGDSAGAYLMVYSVAMQRCPSMAKAAGVTPSGLPVKALGLMSGMFYTRRHDQIGIFLTGDFYGKGWRRHPFRPYTNPEHPEILKSLPPCYFITAGADNLRHYTTSYYEAAKNAGISCKLEDLPNDPRLVHAFCAMYPEYPESRQVISNMLSFFETC